MGLNNQNPLSKMISKKTISLNVDAKDWMEAVRRRRTTYGKERDYRRTIY